MCGCVDLFQHADRNMRVNLCGVEPHVAEHGLNVTDIRAALEHQCRHSMAEDVTRPALADPSGFHVSASQPTQVVRRERDAIQSEKYNTVIRIPYNFGSQGIQIHVQARALSPIGTTRSLLPFPSRTVTRPCF